VSLSLTPSTPHGAILVTVGEAPVTGNQQNLGVAEPKRPKGRTLAELVKEEPLSLAEQKLLNACANGETAHIGDKRPDLRTNTNRIRPAFLRFLALGGDAEAPVHERGLQIRGAWIEGPLDLEACNVTAWLDLFSCVVEGLVMMRDADIRGLHLDDCEVWAIDGQWVRCQGSIHVVKNSCVMGAVKLGGARIDGDLSFQGSHIEGTPQGALLLNFAEIKGGGVYLSGGFTARGTVNLYAANITGDLDCSGGRIEGRSIGQEDHEEKPGPAVLGDQAKINGSVFLAELDDTTGKKTGRFHAIGIVRFVGAKIGGSLICTGGKFEADSGLALLGDQAWIGRTIALNDGFHSIGGVRFLGATIVDNLECQNGSFVGKQNFAISIERSEVGGHFSFHSIEVVSGGIDLLATHVGTLSDSMESWDKAKTQLAFDGFRYDRISGYVHQDKSGRRTEAPPPQLSMQNVESDGWKASENKT